MQHLDEGTIHSWLDGALSPDEAARVEAHVAECPECATAVAEARGFIAASSRVLTALDNAPRGVIPITAPRRRVDPRVWRIAATLLVVAGGTLVVVRTRGADERLMPAKAERIAFSAKPIAVPEKVTASAGAASVSTDAVSPVNSPKVARSVTPTAPTPAPAPSRVASVAAMDAATEQEPLKAVGSPQQTGAKVTLYEVAPGDTVTLTESLPASLNAIVLRGATSTAPTGQVVREKSAAAPPESRADAAMMPQSESRLATGAVAAAPATTTLAKPSTSGSNAFHTITWTDPTTGTTLTLSGRMPEARLQEVKLRIDRERAGAAKKKP